ncbi:MAG: hypothetical protein NXI16_12340 [Alphaproteobacteria bacterium]|nr:hypothetical protein [Alphaproteobacteria bacterium]
MTANPPESSPKDPPKSRPASPLAGALERLVADIDRMATAAERGAPFNAKPLEIEAARLSEAVTALPGAEARTLLPLLEQVIGKLDRLHEGLRAKGIVLPEDRPEPPAADRAARAASAYKTTGRY